MSTKTPRGKIVTFYSYKGGTGRSMALANVAWILASRGKRVLLLDWDLEAPGLHRYFYPFLLDHELRSSDGLIDFFRDFVLEAATHRGEVDDRWYLDYANLLEYAVSIEWPHFGRGRLDLVPAGRQGASYSTRVNSFDWQGFYDRMGGGLFLEQVKTTLRQEYDYVLIDSRTGVSDTAGICTVQLPDVLVVCFTLNNQSIDGAAAVTESVFRQRRGDVTIVPVPTRVDPGEDDRRKGRLEYAQSRFADFQHNGLEPSYWARAPFYYIPLYAYEEILSPFLDTPGSSLTFLQPSEYLASVITGGEVVELDPASVADAPRILARYREVVAAARDADIEMARTAEAFVASQPPERIEAFRRVLIRFVEPSRPGTGDPPRRAAVPLSDLDPLQVELVYALNSAGVVETDPSSSDGSQQLVRDWLTTGWPRLREWVAADRDFLLWLSSLRAALATWKSSRREPAMLLRDLKLAEAEGWLARRRSDLSAQERELIEASSANEEQELAAAATRLAAEWTESEREAARRALPRLVRVAPVRAGVEAPSPTAVADTPAPVPLDELSTTAPTVVQDLLDARVLVKELEPATRRQVVRLARPALVGGWPELREWVDADRDFLRWQEGLRELEEKWRAARYSAEGLLAGEHLAAVERWRSRLDDLPAHLRLFLDASREAQERDLAQRAERAVSLLTRAELEEVRPILVEAAKRPREPVRVERTGTRERDTALEKLHRIGAIELLRPDGAAPEVRIATPLLAHRWRSLLDRIPGPAAERPARPKRRLPWRTLALTAAAVFLVVASVLGSSLLAREADARHDAERLNLLGLLEYERGDFIRAGVLFGEAVERDAEYLPALLNRGTALLRTGDSAEALQVLQRARNLAPESPAVLLRVGIAYYATGNTSRAEAVLYGVANGDSASAAADTYLGLVYAKQGRADEAAERYRRAVHRDSTYLPARRLLDAGVVTPAPTPRTLAVAGPSLPRRNSRVYVQHVAARDSVFVSGLGGRLDNRGFCLPEPPEIRANGPSVASVRYYFAPDSADAADAAEIVRYSLGLRSFPDEVRLQRQPEQDRVRPGTIEVWVPQLPREDTIRSRPWPTREC